MPLPDSRKLICTACQHENEVERVYCHNCGEKLDRSLLPKTDITKPSEDKAKTARQVKKMMNPNRLNWRTNIKTFVLIEFFAALVAAGYLASQTPDAGQPLDRTKMSDIQLIEEWNKMLRPNVPVSVPFTEFDVNYYLNKAVKGGAGAMGIKFERAFAHFEPGIVTIGVQRNVWGLSLYNTAVFKPVPEGVSWTAKVERYAIGRLTVPAVLAKLLKLDDSTLGAFSHVFEKETKQLSRLEKIEPGDGTISFTTRPQQ
jgi:hypothetical protein